jgi:putative membrane protein
VREGEFRQEYGVLNKKYASIPYHRIQNVDLNRNLLERILGLSEIQIHTAGESSVSSEGRLPGLEPDIAENLREQLLDTAQRAQNSDGV